MFRRLLIAAPLPSLGLAACGTSLAAGDVADGLDGEYGMTVTVTSVEADDEPLG